MVAFVSTLGSGARDPYPNLIFRACGSHTRVPTASGGVIGTIATYTRSFHHFPIPVRRFKVVCPIFAIGSTETPFAFNMKFRVGVEADPVFALTDWRHVHLYYGAALTSVSMISRPVSREESYRTFSTWDHTSPS